MHANTYNHRQIKSGRLTSRHLTELTRIAQRDLGLEVDGMAGPRTRAALEDEIRDRMTSTAQLDAPLTISEDGWLEGPGVELIPILETYSYPALHTPGGEPIAIVSHYSATEWGTARSMALRRTEPGHRSASWHVSIEGDGRVVQMLPFVRGAWHVRAGARRIDGIPANRCAVGVELIGCGEKFPAAQVRAAKRLWRALAETYPIPRRRANVGHRELDPARKDDPGDVWDERIAPGVLRYAYGG